MHCPPTARHICTRCRAHQALYRAQGSLEVLCMEQLYRSNSPEQFAAMKINPAVLEEYQHRFLGPILKTLCRRQDLNIQFLHLRDICIRNLEVPLKNPNGWFWLNVTVNMGGIITHSKLPITKFRNSTGQFPWDFNAQAAYAGHLGPGAV